DSVRRQTPKEGSGEVLTSGEGVLEECPVGKEHDDCLSAIAAHRGNEVRDDPPRQLDHAPVPVEPSPTWRTRLAQRPDGAQDARGSPRVDQAASVPARLVRGVIARETGKLGIEVRRKVVVETPERLAREAQPVPVISELEARLGEEDRLFR